MREGFAMLRSGRSWKRRVTATAAGLLLASFVLAPNAAFAQAKKKTGEAEEEAKKGYTMPYFFTMIGIMAAVVPICMAANRAWDFDDDAEEEKI